MAGNQKPTRHQRLPSCGESERHMAFLLFNFEQPSRFGERILNRPSPLPPSHGTEQRHAKTPFQEHSDVS